MSHPFQNIWGKVEIGSRTKIGAYVEIGGTEDWPTTIGDDCSIQAFCYVCPGSTIGNNVFVGPRVTILNDKYPPSHGDWSPVVIEDDVSIGGSVTILPGVRIGRSAKIGAGAVVTRDVAHDTVVVGVPAKELHIGTEHKLA